VLSNAAWRARYGSDPAIIGKTIVLRQQRFDVVGVLPRGFALPGLEWVGFYTPLTMASAFDVPDPWNQASPPSLLTIGRLASGATESQARAWFDGWLRQRFPPGSESAPTAVRVEPRGKRIPLDGLALTMVLVIMSISALVLLVACANVTNLWMRAARVCAPGSSRCRSAPACCSWVAAVAFVDQSRRLATPDNHRHYERWSLPSTFRCSAFTSCVAARSPRVRPTRGPRWRWSVKRRRAPLWPGVDPTARSSISFLRRHAQYVARPCASSKSLAVSDFSRTRC